MGIRQFAALTQINAMTPAAEEPKSEVERDGVRGNTTSFEVQSMKLLVPLDGSPASQHALDHALWFAVKDPDAVVILLNVQNPETLGLSDIAVRTEAIQGSQLVLHTSAQKCQQSGVAHEALAEFGPIAETIERVSREASVDQIIMGTRGLGRLRGLLLGSVATQVVHLTRVPVTLVKEGEG
jgi:nucleotide-binding universal stress UspA family protein